jgi:glycosyltransferase involved in cell wall biosynthesis
VSVRRVVQVVRSDGIWGGVERYIADTSAELARRGWAVTVLGGDPRRMRAQLPAIVDHYPAATIVDLARTLPRLPRQDVVHAHMTAAELPAAVLKRRLGGRLVVTRHFPFPRGSTLPGRLARPLIARQVNVQIAVSHFVAANVEGASVVIHSGVAASARVPEVRENTVLVLQRLEPEKDTATALRAWARAGLARCGWRLIIHGRGRDEAALRSLAAALGIDAWVDFAGFTDEPRAALARSGLLLATTPREAFGLAVVEAMAEATPVVAAAGGAHPETLGEAGAYFEPGDADACAECLTRLAGSASQRQASGAALRDRQRAEFTVTGHTDQLEAVYAG